jgi:hypothetical protein
MVRGRTASDTSVVVLVTPFPAPQRVEVVASFKEAIARGHDESGVEVHAPLEGGDLLVMIEK